MATPLFSGHNFMYAYIANTFRNLLITHLSEGIDMAWIF